MYRIQVFQGTRLCHELRATSEEGAWLKILQFFGLDPEQLRGKPGNYSFEHKGKPYTAEY